MVFSAVQPLLLAFHIAASLFVTAPPSAILVDAPVHAAAPAADTHPAGWVEASHQHPAFVATAEGSTEDFSELDYGLGFSSDFDGTESRASEHGAIHERHLAPRWQHVVLEARGPPRA